MKRNILITLSLVMLMLANSVAYGQRGRGIREERPQPQQRQVCLALENLTPQQEEQIRQLRTAQLEKRLQFRNQMDELRVRKRSLQTQANPDMNAIDRVIDQMADLRTTMMKDAAAHHQQIRSLLTDEQRIIFDSRTAGPMAGYGRQNQPMGRGRGRW